MPEILITHPRLIPPGPHYQILRDGGFDIRLPPPDVDPMQVNVLADLIGSAEAVITGVEPFNRQIIEGARSLRVVARCGVGYDSVDVDACDDTNIVVITTPGTNHHAVAEHALAMMLALSRGFPARDLMVRESRPWKKPPLPRFAGSTVGIVGLGRIGKALAERLTSLQVKVLAFEPFPDTAFAEQYNVEFTTLEDLLSRSDFISLHLPVTAETEGLINQQTLAKMKSSAMLINTARGGLIVEQDLIAALTSGGIAAAGLDVMRSEPPQADDPLLQQENILLSPHAAGVDQQAHHDSIVMVAETLVALHQGRWPEECIVNLVGVTDWNWQV